MTDQTELPKGMKKEPDEFHYQEPTVEKKPMNHSICNYSASIREAIESIKDLKVVIRQVEIAEATNAPALISLVIEVSEQ